MISTTPSSVWRVYLPHLAISLLILIVSLYIFLLILNQKQNQLVTSQPVYEVSQYSGSDKISQNQTLEFDTELLAVQAMPTLAPDLVIMYDGYQPQLPNTTLLTNNVVSIQNQTERPLFVTFSSGASMTLGALGSLEQTLILPGTEEIAITDENYTYQLYLTVNES